MIIIKAKNATIMVFVIRANAFAKMDELVKIVNKKHLVWMNVLTMELVSMGNVNAISIIMDKIVHWEIVTKLNIFIINRKLCYIVKLFKNVMKYYIKFL